MTAVTVASSTDAQAVLSRGGRLLDRCSNGVLWAVREETVAGGGYQVVPSFSTDSGATWADASPVPNTEDQNHLEPAWCIDPSDVAHLVWATVTDLWYLRGVPNAGRTAWTWDAARTAVYSEGGSGVSRILPDVVAFPHPAGGTAMLVASIIPQGSFAEAQLSIRQATVASDGTVSAWTETIPATRNLTAGAQGACSLAFTHTGGDGKTPTSSPSVWVAFSLDQGSAVYAVRGSYSAGSWMWGTVRTLDGSTYAASLSAVWDGTRLVVGYEKSATSTVGVAERDGADTTTTLRTPPSPAGIGVVGLGYQASTQDVFLFSGEPGQVERVTYDRSAGTWDAAWTVVETATVQSSLGVRRTNAGGGVDCLYETGATSPFAVRFSRVPTNDAPTQPTWNTPDGPQDVNAPLVMPWTPHDPDPGDSMSAFAISRQIGSGTVAYWNAATSTWVAAEVQNESGTASVTQAAGWGADADANHVFKVKTWDAGGLLSPYSQGWTVVPSAKVDPVITSGTTTDTSSYVATFTCADMSQQRVTGNGQDTGWTTATSPQPVTITGLGNGQTATVTVQTKNSEGLASDVESVSVTASYVLPATPVITLTPDPASGSILVQVTNPAPSGDQPTVDHDDVKVSRDKGATFDRVASIPVDGTYTDWTPNGETIYEVIAYGSNGAAVDSTGNPPVTQQTAAAVGYYGGY